MEDRVKGARAPKKATASQETEQKEGELLRAVLEELKAHREELKAHRGECAAVRQLLAQVLAVREGQQEDEERPGPKTEEAEEADACFSASQGLDRLSGPVPITFVDRSRGGQSIQRRRQQ